MGFAIEQSTEISHRTDFALLANARGVMIAVEVGVDMGVFARDFLSRFTGHWLIGIDPYAPHGDVPSIDRLADMHVAIAAMQPFHGRWRLFRANSVDVANHWPIWIKPPGFVYLDGDHAYGAVTDDLEAWWRILEPSGILGGHDWDLRQPEVVAAVTDFAKRREVVVRLTAETAESEMKSWYIYKTEPAELVRLYFDAGPAVANPHYGGAG